MSDSGYLGGCACGRVRYEASGPARNLCYCHCTTCRLASGAVMVPWATFARERFRLTRGALSEYRSSPPVLRGFCAACGTSLTYRHEARAGEIDVTLATLDDPTLVPPRMHVWVADKLPWVVVADDLPQHAGSGSGG